jgi:hypothetical protein
MPNFKEPLFHEPTQQPPRTNFGPHLKLAEMPDAWFAETPQVMAQETADILSGIAGAVAVGPAEVADTRRTKRPDETREPAHLRSVDKPASKEVIKLALERTGVTRDDSAEKVQERFAQSVVEVLRTRPYARGVRTQTTPDEVRSALSTMRYRKHSGSYLNG